jgi:hypothetical protein
MTQPDTSAHNLARRRWDQPDNIDRRINAIIRRINTALKTVPPGQQRDSLTRALAALNPEAAKAK